MRDIEFRGKRIQKSTLGTLIGDWVFGDGYCIAIDDDKTKRYAIFYDNKEWIEVDPETVSQYIGLLDRNKTKIFEGDIVKGDVDFEPNGRIGWKGKVIFQNGMFCFWRNIYDIGELIRYHNIEVIGNIHDNPELLKEAKP